MPTGFYTTSEAGAILGLNKATVSAWADAGRLAVERSEGGHRRIPAEQVAYLSLIRDALLTQLPTEAVDADVLAAAAIWHTMRADTDANFDDPTGTRRQFISGYVIARRGPTACLPWSDA